MILRLFLLFTLLPLAELAILVWINSVAGWAATLAVLFVPGIVGVWLVHSEGLRCWREFRQQLARGEPPAAPVLDGLLILVAAVLLVTPGVLTDLVAIVLLVPPVRRAIRRNVSRRLQDRIRSALAKSRWLGPPFGGTSVDEPRTGVAEGATGVSPVRLGATGVSPVRSGATGVSPVHDPSTASGATGVSPVHDPSTGKMPVPPGPVGPQ